MRSTEVAKVVGSFLVVLMGSSDFAQIVDLFMLYRSIWVSRTDVIKCMDCLTEEWSTFDDFLSERIG